MYIYIYIYAWAGSEIPCSRQYLLKGLKYTNRTCFRLFGAPGTASVFNCLSCFGSSPCSRRGWAPQFRWVVLDCQHAPMEEKLRIQAA